MEGWEQTQNWDIVEGEKNEEEEKERWDEGKSGEAQGEKS